MHLHFVHHLRALSEDWRPSVVWHPVKRLSRRSTLKGWQDCVKNYEKVMELVWDGLKMPDKGWDTVVPWYCSPLPLHNGNCLFLLQWVQLGILQARVMWGNPHMIYFDWTQRYLEQSKWFFCYASTHSSSCSDHPVVEPPLINPQQALPWWLKYGPHKLIRVSGRHDKRLLCPDVGVVTKYCSAGF